MSARTSIVNALTDLIKSIDGSIGFLSDLGGNVLPRLEFWDQVDSYPAVRIVAGTETRKYEAAGFKWGFLEVTIKIYVKGDDAQMQLENIMEDIENLLDKNHCHLDYEKGYTADIRIMSITTDEGVLHPIGVGEMLILCRYEV